MTPSSALTPCTYALYVCYVHTLCTFALYACLVHIPCTHALYTCLVRMPCTYALYAWLVRMLFTYALYLCLVRICSLRHTAEDRCFFTLTFCYLCNISSTDCERLNGYTLLTVDWVNNICVKKFYLLILLFKFLWDKQKSQACTHRGHTYAL